MSFHPHGSMSHKAPGVFNAEKSKISFQRELMYNSPSGMQAPDFPGILGQNKILSPCTGNSKWASPTQYKTPFLQVTRGSSGHREELSPKGEVIQLHFQRLFHFLLSLQPLESCRWHRYIKTPTKLCGGKQECVLQKFIKIYDLHLAASI